MSELIEDSLRAYGVKRQETADELITRARQRSGMAEKEAVELTVDETRKARRSRS